ncbi:hypothetical protein Pfo_003755 [Paulownia fortunei]|nr:hypothetical protein Pfo_003755 [Paulownia fortunei]
MKKSKFLKNSKDLLSRSFNPSKCKTSLRLAGSRLKLLRNKKEVQVKQMKREIAQLLESGQDQTARIRVEHVIREEKMMAAYDLIEIYCELIVARLPIIESQKICPIDLKEAIASVVFASPRCGDVPELLDVRKHFTEKYGKDFITAAIELRPECGVSRMLVEKLSAMAPDGQTKIKILSAIAEEHNVTWDAKSFEEKDSVPPSDLLNGPSTFGKESKLHVEPPHFKGPDAQVPQSNNKMHGSPLNFTQVDHRTSLGTGRLPSAQISGVNTAFQHEARPQALGDERAQLFQGDSNTIPLDRQRWNMKFKDATSAAQAAAESAELASMAARAAAELSSRGRIMRQYSTESYKSDVHVSNNGGPETYMNSKLASEQFSKESMNKSFSEHTRLQNEQIDGMKPNNLKTGGRFEDGRGGTKEYNQSASLKSKASIDDDSLDRGVPVVDGYSRKNSLKEVSRGEMSMQRQSFKYKAESVNGWPEKSENVREERIEKQPSVKSSHSYSSISDDVNIFSNSEDQKFEYDAGGVPFLGFGKAGILGEASQTSSRESAAVVFDKYDSDSEIHRFDIGPTYDEQETGFHLPLSGQKSLTDSWSPRSNTSKIAKSTTSSLFLTRKNSSSDFSENLRSMDGSKLDDSMPVTFYESDAPTSESDEDMNMPRHTGISRDLLSKHNQSVGSQFKDTSGQSPKEKGSSGFDRKQLSLSSDDELKSEEADKERNQGNFFDTDPPAKFSLGKPSANQPALEPKKSRMELNYTGNSRPKSEEGLNFEKLTGGFRHKGYNRPLYLKNQFDVSSSFNKEREETTATIKRSTAPPAVESPRISSTFEHRKSTRTQNLQSESDSDSSEEEESLRKSSDHKQELYTLSAEKEVKTKPSLAASNSIFVSDNSDLDEDLPKESLARTSQLRSGISRRTKASASSSGKQIYSKMQLRSEALDFDDGMDRKSTTSKISETPKISGSQRNSSNLEIYEQPTSAKVALKPAKSNFWGPPEHSNSGKATSVTMQESKIQLRSEAHDTGPSIERKPTYSFSSETRQQFQSLRGKSSQLGNSEQPTSAKVASKPTNSSVWETPDQHNSGKANSATIQESKITRKSSAIQESSRPQPKTQASVSSENLKPATLNKTSSNKDDSNQKASHVHPKLPDYDTLVQSLRKNRS